jgi:hypothetical protein
MQRWHYAHSGVSIASELELPEWSQCGQTSGCETPDVVVLVEPSGETDPAGHTHLPLVTASEYRLRIREVGYFHVRDGREIHVRPLPAAEPARVRSWLLGPVWGALCYQRDMFIVHASAVRIDDEAVLFCARAGLGKSTLAAQLCSRGYAVLSDDLCRLDLPAQGPPVVYPSPPRVKLWSDALSELGWGGKELAPDHLRDGKFHLTLTGLGTGAGSAEPLPVRAAYLLAWGEWGVRELHGAAAFHGFLSGATWRMRLLERMGQLGPHSRRCIEFLRHVPLAELTRPRDFPASARTLDFLASQRSRATV